MKIKIKTFGNTKLPKIIKKGDCIDLTIREVKRKTNSNTYFYKLGIAVELPKGMIAKVYPRSSAFKNWGIILTNSVGIIDNTYSSDEDEWGAMVYKLDRKLPNPEVLQDRVFQFEICPSQFATRMQKLKWLFTNKIKIKQVTKLTNKTRGGYGSTGK